eukprot:scaffold9065_cov239-Skeletonema_marinoi.AAC.1
MDFVPPRKTKTPEIPRKKGFQQGKMLKNGHTKIDRPSASMPYNTNRKNIKIDLSNDHEDDNYHGTNKHISDINNPGEGSDSSGNFSDGDPNKKRQQQHDRDKKEKRRRQQQKDKLVAAQQQGFSLNDAYAHASKPKPTSFDGIPIDRPVNEAAEKLVQDVKHLSNDNDDHHSRHTKKKTGRGRNHVDSAFAHLGGSGSKRDWREKPQLSPFAGDNIVNDPLEEAMNRQGTNRTSSRGSRFDVTKRMGSNMEKIVGNGSMTTNRRRKKSKARDDVIDVDSDERIEGSGGKKRKTSRHFDKSNDHSFDSPSSSSVNQGDDGFHAEGGEWESQSSGGRNDDEVMMAALNGAKQYVQPVLPVTSVRVKRDPKKNATAKRNRPIKPPSEPYTHTPRFLANKKDEITEFSDNESTAGCFGETKRSNNTADWLTTNRDRGRTSQQKSNGRARRTKSNKTKKKMKSMGMQIGDDEDEEWRVTSNTSSLALGSPTRRSTRSKSKSRKAKKTNEVIEILDSSSEEESSDDEAISLEGNAAVELEPTQKRPPPIGDLFSIEAARIAVGKKVFKSKCELKFQFGAKDQYMLFSWNNSEGKKKTHRVSLKQDSELRGLKYYVAEENDNSESVLTDGVNDSMTIIAFQIKPTEDNQLTIYTKSYDADSYVTVEVRDTDQFVAMLAQMEENQTFATWFSCKPEIEFYDLKEYTAALIKDTEKENNNRRRSARLSRVNAKKKSNTSEKPLLVFPFNADEEEFCTAASNLNELRLARQEPASAASGRESVQPQDSDLDDPQVDNENEKVKGSARTHYITIREDDIERLAPGEFLNDTLVDFWMKWISGAPNNPDSDVHIFTSHFMSTLWSDGAKAVSSWTAKKKIDIFEKKLIFVPVNSDLHWSLCVVVNPGSIANNSEEEYYSKSLEGSFLLFLDSLSMHRKNKIARSIYEWLNFEWKRLKKRGDKPQPFKKDSMPVLTPHIPRQDNGCDCGVFVCRYAYNLFQMRSNRFSQFDMSDNCSDLFADSDLFEFGMKDIARIR